jgi:hypothetical protein
MHVCIYINIYIYIGAIPIDSLAGNLVVFFACVVGALGVGFVAWLYVYRKTTVVKLAQAGHTAIFCLGGVFLQFSWMTYLGPVTKVNMTIYTIFFIFIIIIVIIIIVITIIMSIINIVIIIIIIVIIIIIIIIIIIKINCMSRPWLLGVAYSIMVGALIRKIRVALQVLKSSEKLTKTISKKMNMIYSIIALLFCILIDLVILLPWTFVSPSVPTDKIFQVKIYLCMYITFISNLFVRKVSPSFSCLCMCKKI